MSDLPPDTDETEPCDPPGPDSDGSSSGDSRGNDDFLGYADAFRLGSGRAKERLTALLEEIDRAAALLGELLREPGPSRRELLQEQPRFHALKLCELLQARSREAWFTDAAAAVELAELAVAVSGRLDSAHYGEGLVEDARALAWAHLGNALRIASDLRRAEEALQTAEEHHRRGGEDAYTGAEIGSFKASLRNAQGRFEEAAALLDSVIAVYREAKDRHREGRSLVQKATATSYAGRQAEAIRLVRQGLQKIDLFKEPGLLVAARHNLIGYLNESGRNEEADRELQETRAVYLELGHRAHLVRLRWLEGKIHRDLGRLDEAEAALREAKNHFVQRGIAFDAALVSLDLAMVHVERGETAELKRLAEEMVPIFESRDVHQEALAAVLLFRQAAEAEKVTLGLLCEMATLLERTGRGL